MPTSPPPSPPACLLWSLQFVHAVMARWPHAVLQFEDFSMEHALLLLERYRQHHLVFNDDIQGTAATALAGLYGALRALGKPMKDLAQQRVVCLGAGSAGMGVVSMICAGGSLGWGEQN